MALKTFRHGVHPSANKFTKDVPLEDFPVPDKVYISLSQHIGAPAKPVVNVGDYVYEGQMVGEAGGFVSAPVFSSVSGMVKSIVKLPTAIGQMVDHIEIENDFKYEKVSLPKLVNPSKEEILQRVKDAGIVGMGGATFPTHVKLAPKDPVDVLIINGAECEPYITCDYRLFLEHANEVVEGTKLLMKALGVDKAYIGIENNKPEAIKVMREAANGGVEIIPLKVKYPQGAEKQIIYAITKRVVPAGGLPAQVGCVVSNTHTAYSVAKAVFDGEPLYKRAMTVSGDGVEKTGNFWVRGGIPFSFIYETLRGEVPECMTNKVINGGPMMGFAQADLRPVTAKGTSSLLFLSHKMFSEFEPTQCINCGRCINHCPMNLVPRDMERAVIKEDFARAEKLGAMNCIECGSCAFICPAKRPLVQAIRLAKKEIRSKGRK